MPINNEKELTHKRSLFNFFLDYNILFAFQFEKQTFLP